MSRLPCHKGVASRPASPRPFDRAGRATAGPAPMPRKRRIPGEVPYVSPDGGRTRYYADRFYLDAPADSPEHRMAKEQEEGGGGSSRGRPSDARRGVDVEHCDRCGEIRRVTRPRGTLGDDDGDPPPPPARPLFDRERFVNSLDLSAAIVGTYSFARFDYLSRAFPTLFPRRGDERNRVAVPTLVLHGQKGFRPEKWSSGDAPPNGTSDDDEGGASADGAADDADEAMRLRGGGDGGGGESSQGSSNSVSRKSERRSAQAEGDGRGVATPPSETDRPRLTYGNRTLKLPKTPRRLKRKRTGASPKSSGKRSKPSPKSAGQRSRSSPKSAGKSCEAKLQRSNASPKSAGKTTEAAPKSAGERSKASPKSAGKAHLRDAVPDKSARKGNSAVEIIVIDSDSDDEPPPARLATQQSAVAARRNNQRPQKSMPDGSASASPKPEGCSTPDGPASMGSSSASVPGTNPFASTFAPENPRSKANALQPLRHDGAPGSSQERAPSRAAPGSVEAEGASTSNASREHRPKVGWGGVKPARAFGGEVYFAQVRPRWRPPEPKIGKRRPSTGEAEHAAHADSDDEATKSVRGVHHPKFFLLFERSGSLVVIVSTSNLSPQTSIDGSWVQRFEPRDSAKGSSASLRPGGGGAEDDVDFGMPSDFGAVLVDFLAKQSTAAAAGSMPPDVFLRRCCGLDAGLDSLVDRYRFEDAQVHLVSTVPGDYVGGLPREGRRGPTYKPRISYGPQRVSYILSRILDDRHIRSARARKAAPNGRMGVSREEAEKPWLPRVLVRKKGRLVMQPTSLGGNWTRGDLETIVRTYLQPHWAHPENADRETNAKGGLLELMDIIWPSMEYFEAVRNERRSIWENDPKAAASATKRSLSMKNDQGGGLFLSSVSFSKLDRSCISRLALFTPVALPFRSASLHFKGLCRLFSLNETAPAASSVTNAVSKRVKPQNSDSMEYLSWFMLTSACLSKGAQGRTTPYRDPESDCMSYSNFELGVLFCSRMVGDNLHDRLYVADRNHAVGCRCAKGKRWYKPHLIGNGGDIASSLKDVKKIHLPIPYLLRPTPYQEDPDSDLMSHTPFMHEIPDGTGFVGNMKLTPLGQRIARDAESDRLMNNLTS